MTRGMDVDNVQNIVNYDAPVYAKTYVHRWSVAWNKHFCSN
jgi:ATP-dependent RNA helicase DDX51/DBP6